MTQTVLLAGASGMLGGRIAHHLVSGTDGPAPAELRLLVRPDSAVRTSTRERLQPLLAAGAHIVEGDLADPPTLDVATRGVDVVVSAVQGGREVIVDGQVALAAAATRNGVQRMLPSDFALDLFKATPGELVSFDLRREADQRIDALGLPSVHVLNGAFLDMFVAPQGLLDLDDATGTATYWGSGDERFDATTVDDTARYAALAALDTALPAGRLAVVGDRPSASAVIDAHERVTGRTYERVSRGSADDLAAMAAQARRSDPWSPQAMYGGYLVYMLTGQTALTDVQNARYPQVQPQSLDELLAASLLAA